VTGEQILDGRDWGLLQFVALITWFAAILAGLYMLAVWLIEKDQATPSRLPAPVIVSHVVLAAVGFAIWVAFPVTHRKTLAWAAAGLLLAIAALGLTMFLRWIPVYRGPDQRAGTSGGAAHQIPDEGHFPVILVACHGLLAVITLILVRLTALNWRRVQRSRPRLLQESAPWRTPRRRSGR